MQGAIINNNVKIGKHCIINTGTIVDHDCQIEDYSNLCPRVTICGNVRIGKNTFIGSGLTVINDITININCNIYAMSLITKDCEQNSVYAGIPGKKIY